MSKKQSLILIAMAAMLLMASCVPAGNPAAACPSPGADTKLLTNEEHGYCLLHSAEYNVVYPPMEHCLAYTVNSMECQFVTFTRTYRETSSSISVDQASGRTASQVADAEIAFLGPDFNIQRTDLTIDGESAVMLDGLPGQDIVRKVVIVHNDLLYTLSFTPWDKNDTALVNLYTTIVNSLHFLPTNLKPLATKTMLPAGFQFTFEYPVDGQVLTFEEAYLFKVTDNLSTAGYQWTFSQNGIVVWDNLRDEFGLTAGGSYVINADSPAHSKFNPGEVEVAVRALMVGDYYSDPTIITIILQPAEVTPAAP